MLYPETPCRHTPGCRGVGNHVCTVDSPPCTVRARTRRAWTVMALTPDVLPYYVRGRGQGPAGAPA